MTEEHKTSESTPEDGVVFAVCIFAVAEDGTRVLVDHRASENLMDCLKNKRQAEREYRDPDTRKKFTMSPDAVFSMTCDKVDAKVRVKEDGSWEILEITGRHEAAYEKKKQTFADAVLTAQLARILRKGDYDFKTQEVTLWTP